MSQSPAFQFYAADFLADQRVCLMSNAEKGAYITLLCHAWNDGSIPSDIAKIARLINEPMATAKRMWPSILPCFTISVGGRLMQKRMEEVRADLLAYKELQAERGRRSGEVRREKAAHRYEPETNGGLRLVQAVGEPETNGGSSPVQTGSEPEANSPSPTPYTTSVVSAPPMPKQTVLPNPTEMRAREILVLLWPIVAESVAGAMTKTAWGQRNKKAALDLAAVGATDDAILAAHTRLSERRGQTVYVLAWVQDEMARGDAPPPSRRPVDEPNASDKLPTQSELRRMGLIPAGGVA